MVKGRCGSSAPPKHRSFRGPEEAPHPAHGLRAAELRPIKEGKGKALQAEAIAQTSA